MPTGIEREVTLRIRANRNKNAEGALVTKEEIMAATETEKTKKEKVEEEKVEEKVEEPKPELYISSPVSKLQDQEELHEMYNEKNVWFCPHIKYSPFKNGRAFTFAEKIQLQNALDQITKVSMIARGFCDSSDPSRRLLTSNKFINTVDAEFVQYLDTMFSKTSVIITIYDLRAPGKPELADKDRQEMSTWACDALYKKGWFSIYIGYDFFSLGITPEQRAIILYYNFVKLATYTQVGEVMFKPEPIPIDHHPAVLLFEDIQDRLTEQRSYEEQTQAELNKAKATQASAEKREQAEAFAVARTQGYKIFPAYDQETP